MATEYPCPNCDGTGKRRDTRNRTSGLAVVATPCDLCDGVGVLRAPLAALALRYRRSYEATREELRRSRAANINRRDGATSGG